jgi:hypothetical protein
MPAPKPDKPLLASASVGPRALPSNVPQIANELDKEFAGFHAEPEEPVDNKILHALDYADGGCAVPRGDAKASGAEPLAHACRSDRRARRKLSGNYVDRRLTDESVCPTQPPNVGQALSPAN